jgi:hypothetical protein
LPAESLLHEVSYKSAMEPEQQAREAEYDSSGVDVTLIRWMLSMTPAERLETLQSFVDSVWQFRGDRNEK